ncbi:hypothetical protein BP00DRAFT_430199 [Aspergillus indologenus CBS 114.80]|uniref:Uncharacterized protein n=1 Tax=Aspergillus indologenus CBS 114.80 TaxID=1450541 RepID=A0A2V5HYB6_9EURO|nr:hypothetical protein BP00DRAFT_430199 [Aspergillus indologenus CBS 114.80]
MRIRPPKEKLHLTRHDRSLVIAWAAWGSGLLIRWANIWVQGFVSDLSARSSQGKHSKRRWKWGADS